MQSSSTHKQNGHEGQQTVRPSPQLAKKPTSEDLSRHPLPIVLHYLQHRFTDLSRPPSTHTHIRFTLFTTLFHRSVQTPPPPPPPPPPSGLHYLHHRPAQTSNPPPPPPTHQIYTIYNIIPQAFPYQANGSELFSTCQNDAVGRQAQILTVYAFYVCSKKVLKTATRECFSAGLTCLENILEGFASAAQILWQEKGQNLVCGKIPTVRKDSNFLMTLSGLINSGVVDWLELLGVDRAVQCQPLADQAHLQVLQITDTVKAHYQFCMYTTITFYKEKSWKTCDIKIINKAEVMLHQNTNGDAYNNKENPPATGFKWDNCVLIIQTNVHQWVSPTWTWSKQKGKILEWTASLHHT